MSWHCAFCGGVDDVNGYVTYYTVSGSVPVNFVVHKKCFAKRFRNTPSIKEAIMMAGD